MPPSNPLSFPLSKAHWASNWLHASSPALRLSLAISLCIHLLALIGLVITPRRTSQLSDGLGDAHVQTVLSLDSPPTPPPEIPTYPDPPTPEPPVTPRPEPTPAIEPAPAAVPVPTREFEAAGENASPAPAVPNATVASSPTPLTQPPSPPPRPVSFAGVNAQRAQRIIYVVDASGPMVSHWNWATDQLRLSLARLDGTQHFQVLIFRVPPAPAGDPAAMRSPEVLSFSQASNSAPVAAAAGAATNAVVWLSGQRLRGASDPLPGLCRALELKPDLILLLSHSFKPGLEANVGRTRESILAELDRLNPKNDRGQRAVVIKTIQLATEDPNGLLQAIALEHGDGPGSYHVVSRTELDRGTTPK